MPEFTIETARRVPFYRHRTYRADTIAEACRQAIEDKNWLGERMDRNGAKEPFVSAIWKAADQFGFGPPVPVPSQFAETVHRQTRHFEILLGLLKMFLADVCSGAAPSDQWIERATSAVALAEAIMAGARDPDEPTRAGGDPDA